MTSLENYKEVTYKVFVDGLIKSFKKSGKTLIAISNELGFLSLQGSRDAMNKETQKSSDPTLSKFMKIIDYDAAIIYHDGKRKYFVNK